MPALNDILDFSSLESNAVALNPAFFSFPELVNRVAASFSLIAEEKGLSLKIEKGNTVGAAHFGDESRIRQLLVNLVNNAVKFTSTGGVTIALSAVEHSDSVQHLRIEIRDTGIGIEPEKLELLFVRFAQADPLIHNRFGGTGLGLAISKRLIELMGGAIGVDSIAGVGTTVWLTLALPCVDPSTLVERTAAASAPELSVSGRRILVVDDVDLNRELVELVLAPYGHKVDQAADGAEAVTAVSLADYDLVLMDVQMPGTDGLSATRAIRAVSGAKPPIVAMTAQALPQQIAACYDAGMDDYLAKPITPAAVFAAVEKWVGRPRPGVTPGQQEELARLRDAFVTECVEDLARVKSLLVSGSPTARIDLQRLVHRFVGTAGMLGLTDTQREAHELDGAFARGDVLDSTDYIRFITKLEGLLRQA